MKLSEAIMLGSTMKPQVFGMYNDGLGTCALGAAADAVGHSENIFAVIYDNWPCIAKQEAHCPVCGRWVYLGGAIACLNDVHEWTRERIAEWVATVEPQESVTSSADEDKPAFTDFQHKCAVMGTDNVQG